MIITRFLPNRSIKYLKNGLGVPSQESSLLKLKRLRFETKNILDIGAYEGHWAKEIALIFPKAHILMVEGQKVKEDILLKKSREIPNTSLRIALLGATTKNVDFNIYQTASSIFKEDNETNAKTVQVALELLDDVVANTRFEKADFIKLDTQGYELEILKGGTKTLQSAQLVLMEVSLLGIYKGAPLVDEVIVFMKNSGFILYDICTLMRRPYDNALYQSDFLFIKQDHSLRTSTRWD